MQLYCIPAHILVRQMHPMKKLRLPLMSFEMGPEKWPNLLISKRRTEDKDKRCQRFQIKVRRGNLQIGHCGQQHQTLPVLNELTCVWSWTERKNKDNHNARYHQHMPNTRRSIGSVLGMTWSTRKNLNTEPWMDGIDVVRGGFCLAGLSIRQGNY